MATTAAGKVDEVILARLDPGEDIHDALIQVCVDREIRTGVVMSITGVVENVNGASVYGRVDGTIRSVIASFEGPMELSGHGIIGIQADGQPYLHVHAAFTDADGKTVVGHLNKGTTVRSLLPTSHFTIFIARVRGVELREFWDREFALTNPGFPKGYPYHELIELAH